MRFVDRVSRYMTLGSVMMVAAPWAADIVGLQGLPKRLVFDLAGW